MWANPRRELLDKWFLLMVAFLLTIFVVITVAVGNCILSLQIFTLAWIISILLIASVSTASANLRTAAAAALCRWAAQELAVLATVVPAHRAGQHRRLSDHAKLLDMFAAADDSARAKYLGFAVDFGVVRTMLVTLLTVLVALWSVLRGSGVFVTMDSVCPLR
ncbi:hypothetical protein DFJ74DRAFT_517453 [Hyaloraphidium curvatum]|nr:hypothetical protein DFJ74DRAFT_517453 [Hyaloraphidium curvatum]